MDYETRHAAARSTYNAGLVRVKTTPEPEGQKFPCESRVRIADDLGSSMDHFLSGKDATVKYVHAHAYGGSDVESYCLDIDGHGEHSWYYGHQLTAILTLNQKTMKTNEDEKTKEPEPVKCREYWLSEHEGGSIQHVLKSSTGMFHGCHPRRIFRVIEPLTRGELDDILRPVIDKKTPLFPILTKLEELGMIKEKEDGAIQIKPIAFPDAPDGEEWHNPSNYSPEFLEIDNGWRLLLTSEVWGNHLKTRCQGVQTSGEWGEGFYGVVKSVTYRVKVSEHPVGSLKPKEEKLGGVYAKPIERPGEKVNPLKGLKVRRGIS